jgi:hypothetical protein
MRPVVAAATVDSLTATSIDNGGNENAKGCPAVSNEGDSIRAREALVRSMFAELDRMTFVATDVSVKRLAWAFGCCKAGSDEEVALYNLLLDKLDSIRKERER